VAQSVHDEVDDADLDEDPDHVQRDEQHGLLAKATALAVLERPVPVPDKRDDGGDGVPDDDRGHRPDPVPRVQRVLHA